MAPKLIAAIVTGILNLAAGLFLFFFMLLALNGFSESDGSYGLVTYVVLAVGVTIMMSTLSALAVHFLMKRGWGAVGSAILGIVVFSGVGAGLKFVCSIVGVLVADFVRVNF